jgi:hypothetical protein
MLKGAISSTKGQHVTRITYCDWRSTYVTAVTLMQLQTHLCDVCRILVMSFITGDAICGQRRNCMAATVTSSLGDVLIRIAYIADHLGLESVFPLMYYFILMQATRYTFIHTRDSIDQHHQRNSYTVSLGWYHNTPWHLDCVREYDEHKPLCCCGQMWELYWT